MRSITPEEMLAIAGGEGESTANAGGGTTTTTVTNGTTTTTTSYANGTSLIVVTRPDGHGTAISTTTTINPSGKGAIGGKGGTVEIGASGEGSGGTSSTPKIVHFSVFEYDLV
ncbi:hypothetical protein LP420_14910 [Massilia sp. B-10]|nr:hypothetical protein LP420_14910 [Massilia sp. B-10]UUZ56289.1 hypothetical protein LP419_14325 [Massilia sp. H-1]